MADPGLVDYIKQQLVAGFRKQQIYDVLLKTGWYKEEINSAFYEIAKRSSIEPPPAAPAPSKPSVPDKPGFFWKLGSALFHPGRLFQVVKKERGIRGGLQFYGVVSFMHLVILLAFAFASEAAAVENFVGASPFNYIIMNTPAFAWTALVVLFCGYLLFLSLPFIAAGVVHLFVYAFRGSKGFSHTFKAVVYSLPPTLLAWIGLLAYYAAPELLLVADAAILLALAWSVYLLAQGLREFHEISGAKAGLAAAIPATASAALFLLLVLYSIQPFDYVTGNQTADALGITDYSYAYDGSFTMSVKNLLTMPITLNTVAVNCGWGGAYVGMESSNLTHLEPSDSITYLSGSSKCAPKEPGESYSLTSAVRYVDDSGSVQTYTKEIKGSVPTM